MYTDVVGTIAMLPVRGEGVSVSVEILAVLVRADLIAVEDGSCTAWPHSTQNFTEGDARSWPHSEQYFGIKLHGQTEAANDSADRIEAAN